MSPEVWTIALGAAPLSEVRGALVVAVLIFKLSLIKAYALSVFGNLLPIVPLLLFWHFLIHALAARYNLLHQCRGWLFEKTRRKHERHFEFFAGIALFVFVAIPIPGTGAWAGTLAAYVFGVPFWRSVAAIGFGVFAAGLIVLGLISAGLLLYEPSSSLLAGFGRW